MSRGPGAPVLRLFGLSHHTAPVEVRERVAFNSDEYGPLLKRVIDGRLLAEGVLVSTCNRTELVVVCDGAVEDDLPGFRAILEERAGGSIDRYLYRFDSIQAVEHVLRVASSLDSMVVGEAQILGQVNVAFDEAAEAGVTGPILDRLFSRARHTAKRVRSETGIGESHVSVASVAVDLAEKIFGSLAGRSALVVGAGETSWLTLQHMAKAGVRRAFVTNRTDERAERLADQMGFVPVPFEKRMDALKDVDVVISATAATDPVFRRDDVSKAMGKRRHRPIFFIDLAMPRDIDPACGAVDGVFLYNLDNLSEVVERNLAERRLEAERGQAIVAEETRHFLAWLETQQAVPTVVALRQRIEAIRSAEEERFMARIGHLSDRDRETLRAYGSSLIGKILHEPTVRLKGARDPREASRLVEATRILFGLDTEEAENGARPGRNGADDPGES